MLASSAAGAPVSRPWPSSEAQHVIATLAVLVLIDDGALQLGTKVAEVWPEFGANVSC